MSKVEAGREESKLDRCLRLVRQERNRQLKLKAEGQFLYTPTDLEVAEVEVLAMIAEELGEVARNVLARSGLVNDGEKSNEALIKELSQVAALSVGWMERLLDHEWAGGPAQ